MYRTILVPLDGSSRSERALLMATGLASATHARLVLLRSRWTALARKHPSEARWETRETRAYLAHIAHRLSQQGYRVETVAPVLPAPEAILAEVARLQEPPPAWEYHNPLESGPALVVMSSHGDSAASDAPGGTTTQIVLANSPAPVLLVRPHGPAAVWSRDGLPPCILAPLDGSPAAEAVLPHLPALAHSLNADVLLLRAVPDMMDKPALYEAQAYLDRLAAHLQSEGVRAKGILRHGAADTIIVEENRLTRCSLLVMATHGETCAPDNAMGRVATAVLNRRSWPTVLVRPSEVRQYRTVQPLPEPLAAVPLEQWLHIEREIRV